MKKTIKEFSWPWKPDSHIKSRMKENDFDCADVYYREISFQLQHLGFHIAGRGSGGSDHIDRFIIQNNDKDIIKCTIEYFGGDRFPISLYQIKLLIEYFDKTSIPRGINTIIDDFKFLSDNIGNKEIERRGALFVKSKNGSKAIRIRGMFSSLKSSILMPVLLSALTSIIVITCSP